MNKKFTCFQYALIRVKTKPRSMTDSRSLRKKARLVFSLSTSSRSWLDEKHELKSFQSWQFEHDFWDIPFWPKTYCTTLWNKQQLNKCVKKLIYNIHIFPDFPCLSLQCHDILQIACPLGTLWYHKILNWVISYLLEARHNVSSNGADQGCNVIHEAFRETVLPGWL